MVLVILGGLTIASLSARSKVRRELAARGLRAAKTMTPKRKRLWLLVGSLAVLGVAAALVLTALNDNLVFFYSPTQIAEKSIPPERRFRLGGLVEAGSVKKDGPGSALHRHRHAQDVAVVYRGLLPDLFREGQGVIAEGSLGRRRRLRRPRGAGQARRELHAARGRQGAQGSGAVEGGKEVSIIAAAGAQRARPLLN